MDLQKQFENALLRCKEISDKIFPKVEKFERLEEKYGGLFAQQTHLDANKSRSDTVGTIQILFGMPILGAIVAALIAMFTMGNLDAMGSPEVFENIDERLFVTYLIAGGVIGLIIGIILHKCVPYQTDEKSRKTMYKRLSKKDPFAAANLMDLNSIIDEIDSLVVNDWMPNFETVKKFVETAKANLRNNTDSEYLEQVRELDRVFNEMYELNLFFSGLTKNSIRATAKKQLWKQDLVRNAKIAGGIAAGALIFAAVLSRSSRNYWDNSFPD
jgi:hypothetical protein